MVIIFDRSEQASDKEKTTLKEIKKLKERGITPKLVSIVVGNDTASKLYLSLKKKAAKREGAVVEVKRFHDKVTLEKIAKLIDKLNHDNSVHGIMIQLPLPKKFSVSDKKKLINAEKSDLFDGPNCLG